MKATKRKALDGRFDHIDAHFTKEKRDISEWYELGKDVPMHLVEKKPLDGCEDHASDGEGSQCSDGSDDCELTKEDGSKGSSAEGLGFDSSLLSPLSKDGRRNPRNDRRSPTPKSLSNLSWYCVRLSNLALTGKTTC